MNETMEYFKNFTVDPEALYSADNPYFKVAGKAQRGLYESVETATRANLSLASDLLDLNRKRMETLFEGKPLSEQLQAQTDILFESGHRVVEWTDELRGAATAYRATLADVANEAAEQATPAKKTTRKTTKAA